MTSPYSSDDEKQLEIVAGDRAPAEPVDLDEAQTNAATSGPVGVSSGAVPEAIKEWAKSMLTLLFRHRETRAQTKTPWSPYSEEDSNIWIGDNASERVKLDELMAMELGPLGYRRIDKLTYRADWSTADVEHLLSIDTYGNPKVFLNGVAGLRNKEADAFAQQCQQRYADKAVVQWIRESGHVNPPWFCSMHFSIGELFGWPGRAALNTSNVSPKTLARELVDPIRAKLIPYVSGARTLQGLLDFLIRDESPMRWTSCGPYYRAALVAYLAARLDADRDKTRAILLTHARFYANGIDMTQLTPESYVDHLLHDADAIIGSQE